MIDKIIKFFLNLLIKYLDKPSTRESTFSTNTIFQLKSTLTPGDVILVEGKQRYSTAIKYLTQSNWSHAALYLGEGQAIEADLQLGVIKIDVDKYKGFHTRICRPVGLSPEDLDNVINYIKSKQGLTYDIKNIFDLAKYLIPTPPVPNRWKRKFLEFGSGDPTKVICSSIIAQAFQQINYPILPLEKCIEGRSKYSKRHYSFFTPSDFDRSPFFNVIKPTLEVGFNYRDVF